MSLGFIGLPALMMQKSPSFKMTLGSISVRDWNPLQSNFVSKITQGVAFSIATCHWCGSLVACWWIVRVILLDREYLCNQSHTI